MDTPFINAIDRVQATGVLHEWQSDTFAAAISTNAQLEGDVVSGAASTATTRLVNTCQILSKDVVVTETQEAVKKAGRNSEMAYQMFKRGKELKRDLEFTASGNVARVAGATATARKMRSFEAWITSNTNRETTATSGGTKGKSATSATGAATDSATTLRTFTELMLKKVMESAFAKGAKPTWMIMGPHSKTVFSSFSGRNGTQVPVKLDRVQGAASLYASNFGDLKAVPDNFSRARSVLGLDPEFAALAYLRPIRLADLAKTGDSIRKDMRMEVTLEMRNEAAHFVIADLKTSS